MLMLCNNQQAMLQHGNYLYDADATCFLQAGHPVFSNLCLSARTEIFEELPCRCSSFSVLAYLL